MIEEVRHRVAIAGSVTDAVTGQAIANAIVRVIGQPLFTQTREDGSFYFLDLLVGQYSLSVTVPTLSSRYSAITIPNVSVQTETFENVTPKQIRVNRPILDPKATIKLSPTRLLGIVKRSDTNQPIPKATIHLKGSESQSLTDGNGQYGLSNIQAGTPTVQVSAIGFIPVTQQVILTAGQDTVANFNLTLK